MVELAPDCKVLTRPLVLWLCYVFETSCLMKVTPLHLFVNVVLRHSELEDPVEGCDVVVM
jgi:hypothetical protein